MIAVLVDEPISADMENLLRYIIDYHRPSRCGMDVPGSRISRVNLILGWKCLSILNRLVNLLRRPTTSLHLVLPLLRRLVTAEFPH